MPDPLVSIVVPTYRRATGLSRCLESIRRTVALPHEVIVVPVADDADTIQALRSAEVRMVVQPTRGGCVQAMNLGFRACRGEFAMQINDDCELLPHSVANAVRFLQAPAHDSIGQAAFFHDSPLRRNIHQQITLDGEWFFTCHVRGLCFANFGLVRRALGERLGWLDERYFMYGADPDFSLKIWHEAKLRVEPCPGAIIRHHELADERAADERPRQHEDNRKLFQKWNLGE